jgi:hypothetical protein
MRPPSGRAPASTFWWSSQDPVGVPERSAGADPEASPEVAQALIWAPRKLPINSPLLADTICTPRLPLYG